MKNLFLIFLLIISINACSQTDSTEVIKVKNETDTSKVYSVVEKMPSYPGGEEKLFEYISKNLKFPKQNENQLLLTRLYIEFIVEKDGSISNIKVLKNNNIELYENVKSVFNRMPKWKPGLQLGKVVRVKFVLPIHITLR